MENIDTLFAARWVIPVEPTAQILQHHAVAIHQGRILAIAPIEQARQRFNAAQVIERPHHVVLPGLVNAHGRASLSLLAPALAAHPAAVWPAQLRALQDRWLDAALVRDATDLALAAAIAGGTTCLAEQHLFPEVMAHTIAAQGMRASIGLPVLDAPTVWADDAGQYLDKALALHDEYRDDALLRTALAPLAPATTSDATLERLRRAADELELPIMLTAPEAQTGALPFERLQQLGLLSPLTCVNHASRLSAAQLGVLAQAGASAVLCPQTELSTGHAAAARNLPTLDRLNLALGTSLSGHADLLAEVRLAALLAGSQGDDTAQRQAHRWLHAATLGGAQALGMAEDIGSLQPGKAADLCCIDLAHAGSEPVLDAAVQTVFAAGRLQVSDTLVAGRALLQAGRLTHLDLTAVLERARHWQTRLLAAVS